MEVKNKKIGFVFTGSFYSYKKVIEQMKNLKTFGAEILPIMSENSYNLDTKIGKSDVFIKEIEKISGKQIIHTIIDAEKIGPNHLTDIMIVAPASGNTISKLACDIIDTSATMAVKSHLRNNLPVVIAPSTNDGLRCQLSKYCYFIKQKKLLFCTISVKIIL